MNRLKPCPFCGSKDIKLFGNHRDSFWFRCNKCASIDCYDTERQAVRAWNKRVAIPSAEPTLDSIRESIEEYVCNVETDTARAQKMLNAWRAIEYDEPLPSAEPKTGHWIVHEHAEEFYGRVVDNYECDNCGDWYLNKTNFCPNCGCAMVEPQERSDKE